MNTISKTHKRFSELLNDPKVLTHPEEFLGPNYKAILDFWMILDELTEEQLEFVYECEHAFGNENRSEWRKAANLACEASREVIGFNYAYHAGDAAWGVAKTYDAFLATRELIGMHLILEKQPLTFFKMFLEVL